MEIGIRSFMRWLKRTFTPAYQAEVEQYLAQSVDLYDLEQRMLAVQRRGLL